jgi:Glycosyl transferases group 1
MKATDDARHVVFVFTYNFVAHRAGGLNRARQILTLLRDIGIQVTVYSKDSAGRVFWKIPAKHWDPQDKEEFAREFPQFELVLDKATLQGWILRKVKSLLCTLMPNHAGIFLKLSVPWLDPNWRSLRARGAAVLIVGYTHVMPELNGLFGDYRVVDQHDIEFVLNQRVGQHLFSDLAVLAKARREVAMLETADMVISLSFSERIVNRMILRHPDVIYLPNLSQVDGTPRMRGKPEYDLLFVGAYSYFNRFGLATFLREAVKHTKKYKIAVAGAVCDAPEIRQIASDAENVKLLGFVDNLHDVYAVARATVCPIWGAGTKTKLLESLQHSRPAFASESSLEGLLPGYEKCVFPLDFETISTVLSSNQDTHLECEQYIRKYEHAVHNNRFLDKLKSITFRERGPAEVGTSRCENTSS